MQPEGLVYHPEFLGAAEEQELLEEIEAYPFHLDPRSRSSLVAALDSAALRE